MELVRETQDVMTLRLLVELYDARNLREDGGISRKVTYQSYERKLAGQRGPWRVWGFRSSGTTYLCWTRFRETLVDLAEGFSCMPTLYLCNLDVGASGDSNAI